MKFVVFGLSISSSWGNGHATLWRGLFHALAARGHATVFFERNVPYYALYRDLPEPPHGDLVLYDDWADVTQKAQRHLDDSDAAIVTSYCPDAIAATDLVLSSRAAVKTFYDMDTGVTLAGCHNGHAPPYIGPRGLRDFDLVLSYVGGQALEELESHLGARRVAPLYGCVDPSVHRPVSVVSHLASDLSYLGTYAGDRQRELERLFVDVARRMPERRFVIGGALYPEDFPWTENIYFVYHLPPADHSAFYSSSRLTLNVTRQAMAAFGYCPSARLFEAAACGTPIVSDVWQGLERFFEPNKEILVASDTGDVVRALQLPPDELKRIGAKARARALEEHSAEQRARELERLIVSAVETQP